MKIDILQVYILLSILGLALCYTETQYTYTAKLDNFKPFDRREFTKSEIISIQILVQFSYINVENMNVLVSRLPFYGASQPFDTWDTDNLRYHTTDQALVDTANFIQQMKAQLADETGRSDDIPFFMFGASYPGAFVAFFQTKFPHLVKGTVASSAVVNPIIDLSIDISFVNGEDFLTSASNIYRTERYIMNNQYRHGPIVTSSSFTSSLAPSKHSFFTTSDLIPSSECLQTTLESENSSILSHDLALIILCAVCESSILNCSGRNLTLHEKQILNRQKVEIFMFFLESLYCSIGDDGRIGVHTNRSSFSSSLPFSTTSVFYSQKLSSAATPIMVSSYSKSFSDMSVHNSQVLVFLFHFVSRMLRKFCNVVWEDKCQYKTSQIDRYGQGSMLSLIHPLCSCLSSFIGICESSLDTIVPSTEEMSGSDQYSVPEHSEYITDGPATPTIRQKNTHDTDISSSSTNPPTKETTLDVSFANISVSIHSDIESLLSSFLFSDLCSGFNYLSQLTVFFCGICEIQ
ncbi:Peptidase S28 like protein, partial [Aduncisulcus paluster]